MQATEDLVSLRCHPLVLVTVLFEQFARFSVCTLSEEGDGIDLHTLSEERDGIDFRREGCPLLFQYRLNKAEMLFGFAVIEKWFTSSVLGTDASCAWVRIPLTALLFWCGKHRMLSPDEIYIKSSSCWLRIH